MLYTDAVLLSLREGQPEAAKIDDKMRKAGVRRGLLNIQTWISGAIFFFINIAVQGEWNGQAEMPPLRKILSLD